MYVRFYANPRAASTAGGGGTIVGLMSVLRTPDSRFDALPDFPFAPCYCEVPGLGSDRLRIHYLDEGPRDAPPVLLLHGEPAWSFLFRTMIPILVAAGLRAVAIDLPGFGRSDKPATAASYSYSGQTQWVRMAAILRLALDDITLVGHGLGALIGLRLAAAHPRLFSRLVIAGGFLPAADDRAAEPARRWQAYTESLGAHSAGATVQRHTVTRLPAAVVAAYDAPFPDAEHRVGIGRLGLPLPDTEHDPAAEAHAKAWTGLRGWQKPVLTAFGARDQAAGDAARWLQERIPGARGQRHVTYPDAGHFLPEERGEDLARRIVALVAEASG